MNITFAIITAGDEEDRINSIIDSIEVNAIPTYEVLVIGGRRSSLSRALTRHIPFDEVRPFPNWITRKKNIATKAAKHENVVYFHDYHAFDAGWYAGVVNGPKEWDVQMHAIRSIDDKRFMDWAILDHAEYPIHAYVPYDRSDLIQRQYISGGYWMARRDFMAANPLDEGLVSFQAEDVEWSRRIRDTARIVMNDQAVVRHLKVHRDTHLCAHRAQPFGVPVD